MIISHTHRFVLFHNPKTAGMSLRKILVQHHDDPTPYHGVLLRAPFDYQLDFAHLRLQEIAILLPSIISTARNYRSVVLVRNPFQRFVSAVNHHFKVVHPSLSLLTMPPAQQVRTIETFVDDVLRVERVLEDYRFVHLSPQTWFLQSGELRLPADIIAMDDSGAFVARVFERLGLPPQAVPHENRSRLDLTHVLASAKIDAFIRDFYAEDFAFFAADPALRHLVEARAADRPAHGLQAAPAVSGQPTIIMRRLVAVTELMVLSGELDAAAVDVEEGRLQEALDRVRAVLGRCANYPRALAMYGQIAVSRDQPATGLAPLQRAVMLDPRMEHLIWLSLCLAKLDCADDAIAVITVATKTMPPTANAYFAVGMAFFALGRYQDAAKFYAKCLLLDPTRAAAHYRYARALHAQGITSCAVECYIEAIRHCSTNADYHADLSSALSELGRFEEARNAAETAVALDPGCIVGLNNLGHALYCLNRSAEALVPYLKAIEACNPYTKAQFGYALALLKCGDFKRGWRQYEWRWQDGQIPCRDLDVPVWRGEDIRGRTILLHAEQGFGDTLQFARFAPLVADRGARVVLEVPAPLVRLMRCLRGVAEVIACGEALPSIDLHCPMASLPLAFELRPQTIPASPYLRIPIEATTTPGSAMHPFLPKPNERPALVVGLVWSGDPRPSQPSANVIDRRRSTSLEGLAPLFDIEGACFISFQFGDPRGQLAGTTLPIVDGMEGVTDFADTAVRLAQIDLLISVDTSIVHLAGGLGMPVWMLSRFDGCWRWLEGRNDTPWYPSMRIFRQPAPGDWPGVVSEVGIALREAIARSHHTERWSAASAARSRPAPYRGSTAQLRKGRSRAATNRYG